MSRATQVTIDLSAIRANYRLAADAAPDSKTMAVIKANAYGHGVGQVADALSDAPAFAVATIDEALELREVTEKPILILQGVFRPIELEQVYQKQLIPAIHCEEQVQLLIEHQSPLPDSCWVILDSGMSRLGFKEPEIAGAIASLQQVGIDDLVVASHMANASSPDMVSNDQQLAMLNRVRSQFPGLSYSLANSAATLSTAQYHMDWNRVGIMLYGGSPFDDISHPLCQALKPAMTLTAEVIAIRDMAVGESAGYGSRWTADRDSRIATLAIGYADGYPRHAPSGTPVFIREKRLPLAGRVSMDMIMVDITDAPEVVVGDSAELFGSNVSINEIADAADTISYHLMTSLSGRVPRIYC